MRSKQTLKLQIDGIPYSAVAWFSIPKCCKEDLFITIKSLQDRNIQDFFAQIVEE